MAEKTANPSFPKQEGTAEKERLPEIKIFPAGVDFYLIPKTPTSTSGGFCLLLQVE
jgi:hypothetical protein